MFYLLTFWAHPGFAHMVMVLIEPWVPEISTALCAKVVPWKSVKMKSGKSSVGGKGASNWPRNQCLNMRRKACFLERHPFSLFIFELTWKGNNSDSRQRWWCFSERNYALKPAVIQKRFFDFTWQGMSWTACTGIVQGKSWQGPQQQLKRNFVLFPDFSKPQVALFPNPNSDMSSLR